MALALDAVCSSDFYSVKHFSQGRISETQLEEIFLDLDQNEVISIIFLMTNNSTDISAVINSIKNDCKDIFFEITKEKNWEEKFLEALITIDNINVVKRLAFKTEEIEAMKKRYFYNIHNVSYYLNRVVKSLYFLCKEFTLSQVKILVNEVYKDLKEPVLQLTEEKMLLEIYILDWLQKKYFSIDAANPELNKLIDILKINGLLSLNLDGFNSWKSSEISNMKNHHDSESSRQSLQLENTKNVGNIIDSNKFPWEDRNHKRLCIIVNQVDFNNHLRYKTRKGSDIDESAIENTFKGLQFDILKKRNLTAAAMIEFLNSLSEKEYNNYAAVFLCILSHGENGEIIFCDDKSLPVEKIRKLLCCQNLKNAFKFIILQSCQGKKIGFLNSSLTTDTPIQLENNSPFIREDSANTYQRHCALYQATVNEYVSIRHETEGSWFIQDACDELRKSTPIVLIEWVKKVNKRVNDRKAETNEADKYIVQVPCLKEYTILEDYYFPKYNGNL